MGSPTAPAIQPAPDPAATAAAQGSANIEAAIASGIINRVGQVTPFGSTTFEQIGTTPVGLAGKQLDVPSFRQVVTLDPTQEQTLREQQELALTLAQTARGQAEFLPTDRFNLEGLPFAPGEQDFAQQRTNVEEALFGRTEQLLAPGFAQRGRALEQNIADRGLPISGEAAGTLQANFEREQNEALSRAALSAVLAGGSEQQRLVALQQGLRGQGIQERLLERTQPINELAAALQGSPALGIPSLSQTPGINVAPPDILGAQALSLQQGNLAAQLQANQPDRFGQFLGIGGQLGAAAIISDRRFKSKIKPIGKINGFNWYSYIIGGVKSFGVIAQEVMKTRPDLVVDTGPHLAVNYGGIFNDK